MFKKAEFVLSDSFHAICFALIFGKSFYYIQDEKRCGDRFASLTKLLGLEQNCFKTPKEILDCGLPNIDFERVNALIKAEREASLERLKSALQGRNTNDNAKFGKIAMSALVSADILKPNS